MKTAWTAINPKRSLYLDLLTPGLCIEAVAPRLTNICREKTKQKITEEKRQQKRPQFYSRVFCNSVSAPRLPLSNLAQPTNEIGSFNIRSDESRWRLPQTSPASSMPVTNTGSTSSSKSESGSLKSQKRHPQRQPIG